MHNRQPSGKSCRARRGTCKLQKDVQTITTEANERLLGNGYRERAYFLLESKGLPPNEASKGGSCRLPGCRDWRREPRTTWRIPPESATGPSSTRLTRCTLLGRFAVLSTGRIDGGVPGRTEGGIVGRIDGGVPGRTGLGIVGRIAGGGAPGRAGAPTGRIVGLEFAGGPPGRGGGV